MVTRSKTVKTFGFQETPEHTYHITAWVNGRVYFHFIGWKDLNRASAFKDKIMAAKLTEKAFSPEHNDGGTRNYWMDLPGFMTYRRMGKVVTR